MFAGEKTTRPRILRSMLIYGMVVAGGPDWRHAFAASAIVAERLFSTGDKVDELFLKKGEALGRRTATLARSWKKP